MKGRYVTASLGLIIVGLLVQISSSKIGGSDVFWSSILSNVASALLISGTFGLVDRFILQNEVINFVVSKVNLKRSIDQTGLTDLHYGNEGVSYKSYFDITEKNIDIVHAYGQTWTRTHSDKLVTALRDTNARIRVILMDPESDELMKAMYAQFNNPSPQILIDKIRMASRQWKDIYESSGIIDPDRLKFYYHSNVQTVALYRFDDTVICHQLHIVKKPASYNFPTSISRKTGSRNDLFTVYLDEIESLINGARQVPLTNIV